MEKIYKVEIITRSEKLNILKDSLSQKGIKGMTVSNVNGSRESKKAKLKCIGGNEMTIDLLPKVRVEILSKESMVNEIVEVAKKCLNTGNVGDGKIIILPVSNVIRIRTNEEGQRLFRALKYVGREDEKSFVIFVFLCFWIWC